MIYISKGLVKEHSTEDLLLIRHCGQDYQLTGKEAALWLNGQKQFAEVSSFWATDHLKRMGLIETEPDDTPLSRYRILTRCICCPVESSDPFPIRWQAKPILTWLQKAGLRLSTAELVYLTEHRITPEDKLLHEENRQRLIRLIYTKNRIQDNLLEVQMENAKHRDFVVDTLLYLIKRKRLVLI